MPITVEETWSSRKQTRSATAPSCEREYLIKGTDDEDEAGDALVAAIDEIMVIGGDTPVVITEASIDERLTEDIWKGTVKWGRGQGSVINPLEQSISFDTTGGRAKVTQSLGTQAYASPGVTAPDFRGAIGVTKNGVEGAEVVIPALQFCIKKQFPAELVTQSYVNALAELTGKYNNNTFAGRLAGEVRFDGATGDQRQVGAPVDISFKFTVSPNVAELTVATIEGIAKYGWQYLWVLYQEQEDSAGHFLVQRPIAVYVEDLPQCTPANFADIGIGT